MGEILVKTNEQSIEELKMGFTENINNIMAANITINENFNGLHIKSEDTLKELEGVKNKYNEDLEALRSDISSNTSRIDDISGQFKNINNTVNKNTVLITDLETKNEGKFVTIREQLTSEYLERFGVLKIEMDNVLK